VKVQFKRKIPRIKKRMRKFHMLRNNQGVTHSKSRRMKRKTMMKRLENLQKIPKLLLHPKIRKTTTTKDMTEGTTNTEKT
jgi:ribosome biogenesis protein Tsr3